MCLAEIERDQWRGIIDEIAEVLHPGEIYSSTEFPAEIAALRAALSAAEAERDAFQAERDQLAAELQAERALVSAAMAERQELLAERDKLRAEVERLKAAPTSDNAALKQRVFTALGELLLVGCAKGHPPEAALVKEWMLMDVTP